MSLRKDNRLKLLLATLLVLGLILGNNHYRHSYVYRPTEIEAFRNIEKQEKIIREWGYSPYFTDFERKIYLMDLELKSKIIPNAEKHNKTVQTHSDSLRVPIVVHEIATQTGHTPSYIQKVMETIDNKVWLRQKLKYKNVLPDIKRVKI